ncbi:hypothetical protein P153DRAFT_154886 [Dothidotthia symphoricarpi CBS 119687]|uniref:Uncharacterized protein n=1 Tax=Dothidotthia symphoricarpi CBS 119687 TaxID=1392245 RepID=A0A6A6AMY3_9PLEO|nr:uncharacterized protein P153DRAFT_154886 [Dothidotthia symphoricarpi CBS 119687]KAF2133342.1 hypothetical protein P153DRAFT_154886 [Dothidotthia symphoricarpi CBS 119687]
MKHHYLHTPTNFRIYRSCLLVLLPPDNILLVLYIQNAQTRNTCLLSLLYGSSAFSKRLVSPVSCSGASSRLSKAPFYFKILLHLPPERSESKINVPGRLPLCQEKSYLINSHNQTDPMGPIWLLGPLNVITSKPMRFLASPVPNKKSGGQ